MTLSDNIFMKLVKTYNGIFLVDSLSKIVVTNFEAKISNNIELANFFFVKEIIVVFYNNYRIIIEYNNNRIIICCNFFKYSIISYKESQNISLNNLKSFRLSRSVFTPFFSSKVPDKLRLFGPI